MNKLFISLVGIVAMLTISCGNPATNAKNETNAPQQQQQQKAVVQNVYVVDLLKAKEFADSIIILDVRTPEEVGQGYVEAALNVNVKGDNFTDEVSHLDKAKTVYVYCRSGHRSQIASNKLIDLGFTDVRNVEGGFMAWEEAGFKVVK